MHVRNGRCEKENDSFRWSATVRMEESRKMPLINFQLTIARSQYLTAIRLIVSFIAYVNITYCEEFIQCKLSLN